MDTHSEMGMMMVLKEGEVSDMAPLPKGFPVCGDFDWSSGEFERKISSPKPQGDQGTSEDISNSVCFVFHECYFIIIDQRRAIESSALQS